MIKNIFCLAPTFYFGALIFYHFGAVWLALYGVAILMTMVSYV